MVEVRCQNCKLFRMFTDSEDFKGVIKEGGDKYCPICHAELVKVK